MVPDDVTRATFPWEQHVDFAAIEAGVDSVAGALAKQVEANRAAFIELLAADLAVTAANPGMQPVDVAVAARLLSLANVQGIGAVAGAQQLVDQAEARYRDVLAEAAGAAADRVTQEAARLGVDAAGTMKLGGLDEYRLDLVASRLAQTPLADTLAAAADLAYRIPDHRPGMLKDVVVEDLRQLSPQPLLTTLARPAVQQADGLGRTAQMAGMPAAKRYYASELMDRNTCGPCSMVDGRDYPTLADARADYPTGTYKDCDGGARCRGSIVAVWATEQGFGE